MAVPSEARADGFSISDVVQRGLCVGCGGCAVACGSVTMRLNESGAYEASLEEVGPVERAELGAVCPFSDAAPDETAIAEELFGKSGQAQDPRTGYYLSLNAGRVADTETVTDSSSGGLTSWLLIQLLERGMIDGVIHVGEGREEGRLFDYCVSTSTEELLQRRKSQYYSTELSAALRAVRGDGKRYALVGVPCFIKAARLLAKSDPVLSEQLGYFLGLVCGHLKSSGFAELMAWQVGVSPDELARVDFRHKVPDQPANRYEFGALRRGSSDWRYATSLTMLGGNWGHALFQLRACDFCDDIFAETADVCFGDAWVDRFAKDWRGTNIVVCRNPELQAIFEEGLRSSEIVFEPLAMADLLASQGGNFRHRHLGLSVRLKNALRRGEHVPRKRIAPGSLRVSMLRKRIIRIRERLAMRSHDAFRQAKQRGDLAIFRQAIAPELRALSRTDKMARYTPARVAGKLGRVLTRPLKRFL
ncbi:Coenzyme F420 hydrogenase/dehydrogenase, beta subunit C-terminal domain [Methyloligella sp. 2.7D]|uniref:Coenzyme F420 hydrogenase/dehydrogenase, beta subunit C-terminal domain n=1 Tax=unclassified Methyloligella TaxID=2625955 RepID=UPI00157D1466|nr:Coenzyme F420 hydrogenase/dehydrogenase, beta subunit C-terminal domain [Methyloligella sp. GL2]QKP78200.1 Coenzyme F420 hydrogenase/dehydrogenase, beta subunit C-terminal domain [Methyloligella sp. GL2]